MGQITKFYAKGVCMYPYLRPGDILYVEQRAIDDIKLGDIAVYRRNGRLFGHRVIRKWCRDAVKGVTTGPDKADKGNDGPVPEVEIAGVIVAIERGGRVLDTEELRRSPLNRLYRKYSGVAAKIKIAFAKKFSK